MSSQHARIYGRTVQTRFCCRNVTNMSSYDVQRQLLAGRMKAFAWPYVTGYIPKSQHYFAKTYGDACRIALSHHESEQRKMRAQRAVTKRMPKEKDPILSPIQQGSRFQDQLSSSFTSSCTPQSLNFPGAAENKHFKSGYTGFVPGTRGLIALGYPEATRVGLKNFNSGRKKSEALLKNPIVADQERCNEASVTKIYPRYSAMVPHYTGYIPGYKYKIGKTYGHHTYNALEAQTVKS